jgi:hypothetical protein
MATGASLTPTTWIRTTLSEVAPNVSSTTYLNESSNTSSAVRNASSTLGSYLKLPSGEINTGTPPALTLSEASTLMTTGPPESTSKSLLSKPVSAGTYNSVPPLIPGYVSSIVWGASFAPTTVNVTVVNETPPWESITS